MSACRLGQCRSTSGAPSRLTVAGSTEMTARASLQARQMPPLHLAHCAWTTAARRVMYEKKSALAGMAKKSDALCGTREPQLWGCYRDMSTSSALQADQMQGWPLTHLAGTKASPDKSVYSEKSCCCSLPGCTVERRVVSALRL